MKRIKFFTYLFLLLSVAACSHQQAKSEFFSNNGASQVWPPAPEQPRVKLLKVFTGPDELTAPKGALSSLFELVTGERPHSVGLMAPAGIVSDGERFIYIADPSARLVHKIDFVDNEVAYISHSGSEPLASPVGVALDSNGNLYVTDSVKAKIYKFSKDSEYLGALGDGVVEFQRPAGIAIGRNDYKYVADVLANKINVFDNKDRFLREFPNSPEINDLNKPVNISLDPKGNVYVTDAFNFSIKMFDTSGNLVRTIGTVGDGPGTFARPKGVAIDSESHIYVVDANFDNFQIFNQKGQLLLYVGSTGKRPGQFFMPNGIFIDHEDRIYVSDSYNQRLQIFQYLKEKQ